jgi:predicted HTH domain antitoxin
MSDVVTIKIRDEVAKYVTKSTEKYSRSVDEVVNELLKIGFEKKFKELYKRYRRGEISLGWMAKELGLSLRDTYDYLEKRNLPLSAGFDRIHRRSEVVEK